MRLPFLRDKSRDNPREAARETRREALGVESGDEAVAAARQSARRRLTGAFVLLAAGVIGFPLLFETEPRPLPPNLPIVTAQNDAGRPGATGTPATPSPRAAGRRDGAT